MSLQRGKSSADLYVDWAAMESTLESESGSASQDWSHLLRGPPVEDVLETRAPSGEDALETQAYAAPTEDELQTQKYAAPMEDELETQKYGLEKYNFQEMLQSWQTKYWSRRCKNDQTGANAVLKKADKKAWKNGSLKKIDKKAMEEGQTGGSACSGHVE